MSISKTVLSTVSMSNLEKLPDDVLVQILSLLAINEAGKTCVLSQRWRNLWKFVTCLNFVIPKAQPQRWRNSHRYQLWMNGVQRLHSSSFIDEFKIEFDSLYSSEFNINKWIMDLLIPKRVKTLQICTTIAYGLRSHISDACSTYIKQESNLENINSLTRITLKGVAIDSPLVEYLILNCQHLEFLSISLSNTLSNLKVNGPSVQLKHLEISECECMKRIELSAPKLVSLNYSGKSIEFYVGDNPNLSELIYKYKDGDQVHLSHDLCPFSSLRSQLKTLGLRICFFGNMEIPQFLELTNLNTLILDVSVNSYDSLIGLTRFIEAAPSLKRFTLNLASESSLDIKAPEPVFRPHPCLKRVEIYGFVGGCPDLGLVMYLLKNAISLEKIVIQPFHRRVGSFNKPQDLPAEKKRANARRRHAYELNKFLPPGAALVVL